MLKHAAARCATLTLACADEVIELRIEDDGQGATGGYHNPLSLGIVGMRERLMPWSGNVSIGPRAAGGTVVVARAHLRTRDLPTAARWVA